LRGRPRPRFTIGVSEDCWGLSLAFMWKRYKACKDSQHQIE
jgi:hypothetical protein